MTCRTGARPNPRLATIFAACLTVLFTPPDIAGAQDFNAMLKMVGQIPQQRRVQVVDSFLSLHPVSPIVINDTTVVFIYAGEAASVTIAGDATAWRPNIDSLSKIAGTDVWYREAFFEADARLDYKFVIDGKDWILDPRNNRRSRSGFGMNSELRMPAYPATPELIRHPDVPGGMLTDTTASSTALGNDRPVRIYVPALPRGYADSLGLIVVHDGLEFIDLAGMDIVLDNLIAQGRIPPVIAVFVPPVNRTREYAGDQMEDLADFITGQIIGGLQSRYPISRDPSRTVVMGASNGGNISLYMAMKRPDVFGRVAAFSSNVVPSVQARFASEPKLHLRLYLDIGTYDIPPLIPLVRTLEDTLTSMGYDLESRVWHDGHAWANWAAHIDDALTFLFARQSGD